MRGLRVLSGDEVRDEPLDWPVRAHTLLGGGLVSDFVRDDVETPDGARMKRDYLLHPGAVGVIALDDAERVVVVRQFRHPVGYRLIEPPAGLLDASDGDGWLAAAQRELAEEVQLAASDWRVLVDYMTSPGCLQESLRVYLARGLTDAARPDGFVVEHEEADMEVCLVPLDDLVDAIYAGRVQNPTMVVGALAAYAALRTGRVDALRTPGDPWPARAVKAARDAQIHALGGQTRPR
ncbi:NUDIX domain-containing protein [Propioniciclava sp.]|uniref:NUDIX domain-containing protein n=1 Tax=Propioniciclava sp. TaxID=2038686 RepID=UPI0039E4BDEF